MEWIIESIKKCQGIILKKKKSKKKAKAFSESEYKIDNWKELISIIEMINNNTMEINDFTTNYPNKLIVPFTQLKFPYSSFMQSLIYHF
ncbi:hypothetical protein GCM10009122_23450 [Fulvivirga kasyanovii]